MTKRTFDPDDDYTFPPQRSLLRRRVPKSVIKRLKEQELESIKADYALQDAGVTSSAVQGCEGRLQRCEWCDQLYHENDVELAQAGALTEYRMSCKECIKAYSLSRMTDYNQRRRGRGRIR